LDVSTHAVWKCFAIVHCTVTGLSWCIPFQCPWRANAHTSSHSHAKPHQLTSCTALCVAAASWHHAHRMASQTSTHPGRGSDDQLDADNERRWLCAHAHRTRDHCRYTTTRTNDLHKEEARAVHSQAPHLGQSRRTVAARGHRVRRAATFETQHITRLMKHTPRVCRATARAWRGGMDHRA
jgi:hypothetical protein